MTRLAAPTMAPPNGNAYPATTTSSARTYNHITHLDAAPAAMASLQDGSAMDFDDFIPDDMIPDLSLDDDGDNPIYTFYYPPAPSPDLSARAIYPQSSNYAAVLHTRPMPAANMGATNSHLVTAPAKNVEQCSIAAAEVDRKIALLNTRHQKKQQQQKKKKKEKKKTKNPTTQGGGGGGISKKGKKKAANKAARKARKNEKRKSDRSEAVIKTGAEAFTEAGMGIEDLVAGMAKLAAA